jgi:alpha 1,3-glucosidase
MALYGSIPFMTAHRKGQTSGVLLLNSAEMWIDVEKSNRGTGFTGMLRRLQEFVAGVCDVISPSPHSLALVVL